MRVSIFIGDLADAPAEVLCTSTNPRLSLFMGTGASIRARGGFEILRACEAIIEAESKQSGKRTVAPGSAHVTTAGSLPCKAIVHCVASDLSHRSSPALVRSCVTNALLRGGELQSSSLAMPVFATGHAHLDFATAVSEMCGAIRESSTNIEHIYIVIFDRAREEATRRAILEHLPGAAVDTVNAEKAASEPVSTWFGDDEE